MAHCFRCTGRKLFFLTVISLLGLATVVWAGTTGKVAGQVEDAEGSPMAGVAVLIEGSRLGATTDADGRYLILQVSPGTHTVVAQMIGYRTMKITEAMVNADRTTQVNFTLAEESIEMQDVVVVATRPDIEVDVTGSQMVVDASRVAEAPVSQMLDFLAYEPGVSVTRDNEMEIRGGGPSEIRFQVDGLDRTDALTGKAHTQLNQVLVSEVTVLTGGFNAEYGNVRAGMVNVVVKDGTEGGGALPWVSGVVNYAPAQRKHFGPGAYDSDQYDYWLMSSESPFAEEALTGELYWPLLYESTREYATDPTSPYYAQFRDISDHTFHSQYRVFEGWEARASAANVANRRGSYGKADWTAAEAREAWEYEANMDEVAWQYGNEPDRSVDLAAGWALPAKLGGVIVGYSYNREMTAVPAVRPYYTDQSIEGKLTLTPTDALKIRFSFMTGTNESTGGGSKSTSADNPELAASGTNVTGNDPTPLRSAGQLIASVEGYGNDQSNNKMHTSYNSLLDGDFTSYGASLTYTFGPLTFLSASYGHSESNWDLNRDIPRVDMDDWTTGQFKTPTYWGFGGTSGWLYLAYKWTDTDGDNKQDLPVDMADALDPDRVVMRSGFSLKNVYPEVPTEAKYITREFTFGDSTTPALVVSPQGYLQSGYTDLSGRYELGGGAETTLHGGATQNVFRFDLTHSVGAHTLKGGAEFIRGDLTYFMEQGSQIMVGSGSINYSEMRSYGGLYPSVNPSVLGIYFQDKFETEGMVANAGFRIEQFDGGQDAYYYHDIFSNQLIQEHGFPLFEKLVTAMGWQDEWGDVPQSQIIVTDSLGSSPMPWDVVAAIEDRTPAEKHWTIAPRFGISHPVSDRMKFFFNYGIFYSMQKSAVMYGLSDHDGYFGLTNGETRQVYNPNLRPARTSMYEVGVERLFKWGVVGTLRVWSKYNTDQVADVRVQGASNGYTIFRNMNYEDVRGLEIKLSRTSGRFVNGWFVYERSSSRQGEVAINYVENNPINQPSDEAFQQVNDPTGSFSAMIRFGTPMEWGALTGGWGLSIFQQYHQGGDVYYNPDPLTYETRELPDEYILPSVDYWNTDMKLTKSFRLPGGRSISVFADVTNVWNTKRLRVGGTDYLEYVYRRRKAGDNIEVYSPETFDILTEPYLLQYADSSTPAVWKAPLAPRTEWLHYLNPRFFRFGLRFEL